MADHIEFDEERHEYRVGGQRLPSVTQVINAVIPVWQAGEFYLQRGRALHLACELLDQGRLDRTTVHDEIAPRVRAWEKFIADSGAIIHKIERRFASKTLRFAGTIDRTMTFQGSPMFGSMNLTGFTICDLKSSLAPQVAVQLGAYAALLKEAGENIVQGVAVELRDDGQYRCQWFNREELRRGQQTFLACLSVYNFIQENNLKVNP